jgi:anaerobic selenocysteine-containing dehydrogenase
MKIDRRCFLSLGVGAAAGITLSPLPWKLTDDSSIWSQMWPWTPVPPKGEANYVNSVCTLCPGCCGISVRKIDERAVKIEGASGYPGNDGSACPLGYAGLQLLYGPTKIQTPLKKVGEKWEKISWDEAVSEVAKALEKLRADGKSSSLACITGTPFGTVAGLFKRFLKAYGSPNFMHMPSYEDAYALTLKFMQGADAAAGFDFENATFVLSFGSGVLEGWGSPVRMIRANSLWKDNKVKLVQVEPRLSNTAAKSDQWIPIQPGTEAVLALGIAHVMIKESLYHKAFVEQFSAGFEDWKSEDGKENKGFKSLVLEAYSPAQASAITGVSASVIEALAKEFAASAHPVAIFGRGQGKTPGSVHELMAIHALNALAGNINQKGGVLAIPTPNYINWDEPQLDEIAQKGLTAPRVDGAGSEKFRFSTSLVTRLAGEINPLSASPIEVLFISGANPVYSLPDAAAVRQAFDKIPFVVSFASHMDETAEMADLILPNHGYFERYEDVAGQPGAAMPIIGLAKPVISPQHNTRHVGDVIIQLAKTLGEPLANAFPWSDYNECLNKTLGEGWDGLLKSGVLINTGFKVSGWEEGFNTPSRKFMFMSESCQGEIKPLGIKNGEGYPLVLIPYDSLRLAAGQVADPPFLMKIIENTVLKGKDIFVEVNPKTAGEIGLEEGVYARLTTPRGAARVRVHLSQGIMPGVIAMPRGLGHTGPDAYMAGKGVNVNELIDPAEDSVSGLDGACGIRANLTIG